MKETHHKVLYKMLLLIWENGIEICIISYKKRITSPGSMQDTGCLGLVHWDDPEGWYGEGGGRGVQDWEHVYARGGFMLMYGKPIQYCKVISLQLNKFKLKKTKRKKKMLLFLILKISFQGNKTLSYNKGPVQCDT